jgi:hypothetical protein
VSPRGRLLPAPSPEGSVRDLPALPSEAPRPQLPSQTPRPQLPPPPPLTSPPGQRSLAPATRPNLSARRPHRGAGKSSQPFIEVGQVDPRTGQTVRQLQEPEGKNIMDAVRSAPEVQSLVAGVINAIPGVTTPESPFRIKTRDRITQKADEYIAQQKQQGVTLTRAEAVRFMPDLLGARLDIENIADVSRVQELLQGEGLKLIESENKIDKPAETGYRAVHQTWQLPSGVTFELQLVPREVGKVQESAHKLYKEARGTLRKWEPPGAAAQRALDTAQSQFGPAWAKDEARGFLNQVPAAATRALPRDYVVARRGTKREGRADVEFESDEHAALYQLGKTMALNHRMGRETLNQGALEDFARNYPQYVRNQPLDKIAKSAQQTLLDVHRQIPRGESQTVIKLEEPGGERGRARYEAGLRNPAAPRVNPTTRAMHNSKYAGGYFPPELMPPDLRAKYPDSVFFKETGFPDFDPHTVIQKDIEFSATPGTDVRRANKAAGFTATPDGYVWHHHENGTTMQLVPKDLHRRIGHWGGRFTHKAEGLKAKGLR